MPNNVDPRYGQRIDRRTGLTEIEAIMRQEDPPPPGPKAPRKQINFPLPWKHKGNGTQTASAEAMRDMVRAHEADMRAAREDDRQREEQQREADRLRDRAGALVPREGIGRLEGAMAEAQHDERNRRAFLSAAADQQQQVEHRHGKSGAAGLLGQVPPQYTAPSGMGRAQILHTIPAPSTAGAGAREVVYRGVDPNAALRSDVGDYTYGGGGGNSGEGTVLRPRPAPSSLYGVGAHDGAPFDPIAREEERRHALAAINSLQASALPADYNPITGGRGAAYGIGAGTGDRRKMMMAQQQRPQSGNAFETFGQEANMRMSRGGTPSASSNSGGAAGVPSASERAGTTDIFGNPAGAAKFSPAHLDQMRRDRAAMDAAVKEADSRSSYDHFANVMKRTVLVGEARRLQDEARARAQQQQQRFADPNGFEDDESSYNLQSAPTAAANVDIFGNPKRAAVGNAGGPRQQQQRVVRSQSSPNSGGAMGGWGRSDAEDADNVYAMGGGNAQRNKAARPQRAGAARGGGIDDGFTEEGLNFNNRRRDSSLAATPIPPPPARSSLAAEEQYNNANAGNLRVIGGPDRLVPAATLDRNRALAAAAAATNSTGSNGLPMGARHTAATNVYTTAATVADVRAQPRAIIGGQQQQQQQQQSRPPFAVDDTYFYENNFRQQYAKDTAMGGVGAVPDFVARPSATSYVAPAVTAVQQQQAMAEAYDEEARAFAGLNNGGGMGATEQKKIDAFYRSSLGRKLVVAAGGWGAAGLRTILNEMDTDRDGVLNRAEFKHAMIKFGAELDAEELSRLMRLAPVTADTYLSAKAIEGKANLNLDGFFAPAGKSVGASDRLAAQRRNYLDINGSFSTVSNADDPYSSSSRRPSGGGVGGARQHQPSTIPDPLPSMVVISTLLHFLRRGERMPAGVEECVRQCYRAAAKKAGGLVTAGQQQARAGLGFRNPASARRVNSAGGPRFGAGSLRQQQMFGAAGGATTNVTDGSSVAEGIPFQALQAATNYAAHSSYETCQQGALRKVSMAHSAAWGQKVRGDTIVTEEMFVNFWSDARMGVYNDSDFVKMLRAMYPGSTAIRL